MADRFVHRVRPRYAEVDQQGVVFNAHWLTYFDEACTRYFDWLGYRPSTAFFEDFDLMLGRAVLEWHGPAGFDDHVDIAVTPTRLGNASFDVEFAATVDERPVCTGTITYVSVKPREGGSVPIPDELRTKLEATKPGEA